MKKLIVSFYMCTIISTGHLQEISRSLYSPTIGDDNAETQIWPLQETQRRGKPCSRRRDINDVEEPWIPSYSSRITHHLPETAFLQPQALKNEGLITSSGSTSVNSELNSPSRRSFNFANLNVPDNDDDCIELPESAGQAAQSDVESKAIKIIKDCLKNKQNTLEFSRRSMANPDDSDNLVNEYEYSRDPNPELDSSLNAGLLPESRNKNPAVGTGITKLRSKGTLLNPRICYACSTATNPSCWEPDKKTTVKYCTQEKSCVTKSFGTKNALTIIRDCSDTCENKAIPGIEPKYKSCHLCHSDFCNGAFSINNYNKIIILVIGIIKCAF